MDRYYFILLLFYLVLGCEAARILIVIPTPSISHQVVFNDLTKELANRGHEVVRITTDPAFPEGQTPVNLTEINVHDETYKVIHDVMSTFKLGDDLYDQMIAQYKIFYRSLEKIIKFTEVSELLKNKKDHFDLLMIESLSRPALIFSHFFKAPVISISSLGMTLEANFATGASSHPLLYPSIFHEKIYNLTMWEKIVQLWKHVKHDDLFSYYEVVQDKILTRLFGPDVPTIRELTSNIDMYFLNIHPIWTDNQPVPPNIIYIGGIHTRPHKDLPQDLKSYLDSSENGVIYMSLGTNVRTSWLGKERTQMFMEVFSKLPYNVLLKWDTKTLQDCPKNVKIVSWMPQSDLLRHTSVKLFITQAGLQSTEEAINAGVPLIALPIIADQFYNSEKFLKHKIGLKFDITTVTADELKEAITTIIDDKSYRDNVIRLRSIMEDQPQSPLERAVWWTEYVLRHGGARHLRAPAANMSWAEYYELELVLIILTCFVTFVVIISACLYYFVNYILKSVSNKKIKRS